MTKDVSSIVLSTNIENKNILGLAMLSDVTTSQQDSITQIKNTIYTSLSGLFIDETKDISAISIGSIISSLYNLYSLVSSNA